MSAPWWLGRRLHARRIHITGLRRGRRSALTFRMMRHGRSVRRSYLIYPEWHGRDELRILRQHSGMVHEVCLRVVSEVNKNGVADASVLPVQLSRPPKREEALLIIRNPGAATVTRRHVRARYQIGPENCNHVRRDMALVESGELFGRERPSLGQRLARRERGERGAVDVENPLEALVRDPVIHVIGDFAPLSRTLTSPLQAVARAHVIDDQRVDQERLPMLDAVLEQARQCVFVEVDNVVVNFQIDRSLALPTPKSIPGPGVLSRRTGGRFITSLHGR